MVGIYRYIYVNMISYVCEVFKNSILLKINILSIYLSNNEFLSFIVSTNYKTTNLQRVSNICGFYSNYIKI